MKNKVDYKNGKIYVIRNHINNKVYVGSTTQLLSKRFSEHKSILKRKKHRKIYSAMDELGKENFYIELIELFPCETKEQLVAREGHFIRQHDSVKTGYNCLINGRTISEWREDNKEKMKDYHKNYRQINVEKLKENKKNYHIQNKEKICEKVRNHYEENKEEINKRRNETVKCECGFEYTLRNKARHFKTQKHKDCVEKKNLEIIN